MTDWTRIQTYCDYCCKFVSNLKLHEQGTWHKYWVAIFHGLSREEAVQYSGANINWSNSFRSGSLIWVK